MADTGESKEVEQPPFDPNKLLEQLGKLVKDNQDASGGGKSWLGTLIILAAVLAGVAIWSWIAWRKNKELAKLRHEKVKAQIMADQAEVDRKVAENDAAIAAASKVLDKARDDLRVIEEDIRAEEGRYEADLRAIDSIRSWRDVPGTR